MPIKPLFNPMSALKKREQDLDKTKPAEDNIYIVFDDSSSMMVKVPGSAEPLKPTQIDNIQDCDDLDIYQTPQGLFADKTRITLAKEGLVEFMRNCVPRVTGILVAPLNTPASPLTKNLPGLAKKLENSLDASGSTPLFQSLDILSKKAPIEKITKAVIFTDGEPTDYPREGLWDDLRALKIPIDFIIIGNKLETQLNDSERQIKDLCLETGGFFLICKDGKVFKEKLKYFAPLLRYLLPSVASKES